MIIELSFWFWLKSKVNISVILFSFNLTADDDSISRFVYEYLKRINEFIDEQDYENAERELEIFARRYFLNEQSYERALINQLYGNFYAIQGDYTNAITWYEKSLKFRKMPFITGLQVRKNLAQCYFQSANYQETIRVLEEYIAIAKKRGQLYAPIDLIMLGISYYQTNDFIKSYENISLANSLSTEYKEDWLGYELALAVKLEKYDEAIRISQLLIFVNPEKKEYWKQISGLYYSQDSDDESLAGLELAYENGTLTTEKEFLDLSRYYLYKALPQKAVKVIREGVNVGIVKKTKKNYELISQYYQTSFFKIKNFDPL